MSCTDSGRRNVLILRLMSERAVSGLELVMLSWQ
jgi:hypothetical protein